MSGLIGATPHPRPLSEPDMNLSAHPAPTIQPFWHNSLLPMHK